MYEEKIKCMNSGKNEQLGKKEKKDYDLSFNINVSVPFLSGLYTSKTPVC